MSQIKYSKLDDDPDGYKYILDEDYVYYSRTFNRTKTLKKGMKSDGATGVRDVGAEETGWRKLWAKFIVWFLNTQFGYKLSLVTGKLTAAWYVHDGFCEDPYWDDGTPVSNFIASCILAAILYTDLYRVEAYLWWVGTFFFGGELIKEKVGWVFVKDDA